MLFHGISGDHIQGIMEEMERRSKTESRLAKGMQLNGRESVRAAPVEPVCEFMLTKEKKGKKERGKKCLNDDCGSGNEGGNVQSFFGAVSRRGAARRTGQAESVSKIHLLSEREFPVNCLNALIFKKLLKIITKSINPSTQHI